MGWQDKKGITITYTFQNVLMSLEINQTKYGWIRAVNFTISQ